MDYSKCELIKIDNFNDLVNYIVERYCLVLVKNEKQTKDGYDVKTKNSKISFRYNQKGGLIKIYTKDNNRIELYPCRGNNNCAATIDLSDDMKYHKNKSGAVWYDKTIKISEMIFLINENI